MNVKKILVYLAALSATLFWGASFIWYKEAYLHFDPISVIFYRLILAAVLLIAVTLLSKKKQTIEKEDIPMFFLLSFFEPFCYFLGESFGMRLVSATLGSLIIATIPLFTPIFAYFLIREKITFYGFVGLVISFCGVALVIFNGFSFRNSITGVLFLLLAVISANLYGITLKKLVQKYSGITIVKYQSIIGVLYFLPLFLLFADNSNLEFDFAIFIPVIKLSIFGSVLAFIFITYVIRRIGVINANIFANMIPVYTTIMAYIYLQEIITIQKLAGMLLVISGLFISQIPQIKKRNTLRKNRSLLNGSH